MNRLWMVTCLSCMVALSSEAGPRTAQTLQRRALSHYGNALEHYGVAMGERDDPDDPACKPLLISVAELVCLKGDREGCLDASRRAGRALGPYAEPLGGSGSPAPESYAAGRTFTEELHRLSAGWGKDCSLASEGLGLFEQLQADRLRRRAREIARPAFDEALRRARARKPGQGIVDWLEAERLAWLMLDQEALAEVGVGLAGSVVHSKAGGEVARHARPIAAALARARDVMAILDRAAEPGYANTRQALKLLALTEKAAADLQFELGPSPERFQTDLRKAHQQLRALARRAPLRSRASALLVFLSSYAGVLASEPGAAAELRDLRESLVLTDPYLAARAQGLLGRDALLAGDFFRAAGLLQQAEEELANQTGSEALRGLLAANRAQALFYLGHFARAADGFASAAAALGGRPASALKALLGRAHSLVFAGRAGWAGRVLDRAEALLPGIDEERRAGLSRALRLTRALLLFEVGRLDQAAGLFEQVAAEALDAGDVRSGAVARTNLAELHNDRGRPERALAEARAALKWLNQTSQADVTWQALCEKGRALASLGRTRQAEVDFNTAMDLVEHLRARIGAEGSRRSFSAAKERLYRSAVSLLSGVGRPEQSFRVSERARGRAFLDMLGERRLRLGDPAQQARLGPARERMLRALPPLPPGFGEPAAALTGSAPRTHPLGAGSPRPDPSQGWLGLVTVNPARVADVKRVLEPGEGLLSFFHDGRRLHGFLITPGGLEVGSMEIDGRALANRVADLLRTLRRPARTDRKVRRKAGRLYQVTLEPLRKRVESVKRLVVVPWGPLHYVPFGALWDGERYLVDAHEISVVPSASVLVMIRSNEPHRRRLRRPSVLALGNPATDMEDLPAAEAEADLLGELFRGARVRKREQATRQEFLDKAGGARLIHLASHGVFLPGRPMESYLALAGPSPEQGRLSALKILGVDLTRARMVMLSACSSGEVDVHKGDEIVGLARAFLHAGAPALVASLWPLADAAALELVGRLYRGIRSGLRPSAALTLAARELKADQRFSHPFFWAPYELIGS